MNSFLLPSPTVIRWKHPHPCVSALSLSFLLYSRIPGAEPNQTPNGLNGVMSRHAYRPSLPNLFSLPFFNLYPPELTRASQKPYCANRVQSVGLAAFLPDAPVFAPPLRRESARHFASAVLGNPIWKTRYNGNGSILPPWSRCIFLWNSGCGSPVLHEHGQPRTVDVFPARNSLIFEELESSESGPLWVPYSDSSRRASAPTPHICSQMGR